MDRNFACLVAQLAVVLVWDLELQASPSENPPPFPPQIQIPGVPQPLTRKERTLEDRRAVLGTFIITSVFVPPFAHAWLMDNLYAELLTYRVVYATASSQLMDFVGQNILTNISLILMSTVMCHRTKSWYLRSKCNW